MSLYQIIFNWGFGIVGALGGFLLRATWDAIRAIKLTKTAGLEK